MTEAYFQPVVVLILFLVAAYISYRFWFDPKDFLAEYRDGIKKMPSWYPFKNTYISISNKPAWIWVARIGSTIILLTLVDILLETIL